MTVTSSWNACASSETSGRSPATTWFIPFSTIPGASAKNATSPTTRRTTTASAVRRSQRRRPRFAGVWHAAEEASVELTTGAFHRHVVVHASLSVVPDPMDP